MGLTVGEAIELEGVRELLLDAGRAGLGREIQHVTVVEVAEDVMWKGKEFLITAFANCREQVDRQLELMESAAHRGCAALAILLHPRGAYMGELPSVLLDRADELALPLFRIPTHVPYIDIIFPIYREIVNRQARELQFALEAHNRMSELVLSGRQLPELVALVASLVGNPVLVLDRWGSPLAGADPARRISPVMFRQRMSRPEAVVVDLGAPSELRRRAAAEVTVETESGSGDTFAKYPIRAGRTRYGDVVVWLREAGLTHLHLMALEQACTVLAFYMEKERVVEEARAHLRRDLLDEIVMGADPAYIEARLGAHGWPPETSGVVMVLKPEGLDGPHGPESGEGMGISDDDYHAIRCLLDGQALPHIVIRRGDSVVALVATRGLPADKAASAGASLARAMVDAFSTRKSRLAVGVGGPFGEVAELRRSYDEAVNALAIGKRVDPLRGVFEIRDLAGYYYLARAADPAGLNDLVMTVLGPLQRYDDRHGTTLVETLRIYFTCDGNVTEAARRLYVHRNTLLRRLQRIREVLGFDPFEGSHRLNFQLAFAAHVLRG